MRHLLIFDVSGGELVVILVFVLIFFGSKGIPGIARTMGRAMRQIRDASAEVQREIQRGTDDVKQGYEEQRRTFTLQEPPQRHAPTSLPDQPPTVEPPPPGGSAS